MAFSSSDDIKRRVTEIERDLIDMQSRVNDNTGAFTAVIEDVRKLQEDLEHLDPLRDLLPHVLTIKNSAKDEEAIIRVRARLSRWSKWIGGALIFVATTYTHIHDFFQWIAMRLR